ncbi:conserved hypothetical protein [Coccidioides posadasii str. Silveira]|uniref:Uncharacterized protein n=1 Tax=Coccidioides posadasii (strain RMSCC 757 / Silveira) TaxID=443226 RepID=E9D1I2_COCPS|nr:conserved hypothetical protein [Coccidioides posadasii str. Silveira]
MCADWRLRCAFTGVLTWSPQRHRPGILTSELGNKGLSSLFYVSLRCACWKSELLLTIASPGILTAHPFPIRSMKLPARRSWLEEWRGCRPLIPTLAILPLTHPYPQGE